MGSDKRIGHAHKKFRVIFLPETAPATMVDIKPEDVVVEEGHKSGVEMSSAVKDAYEVLKRAIKFVPGVRCSVAEDSGRCGKPGRIYFKEALIYNSL